VGRGTVSADGRISFTRLGRCVAAIEPFRSRLIADGAGYKLTDYVSELRSDVLLIGYTTTRSWAMSHRDTIVRFNAAILEGEQYIAANPDQATAIEAKYLGFSGPRARFSQPQPLTITVFMPMRCSTSASKEAGRRQRHLVHTVGFSNADDQARRGRRAHRHLLAFAPAAAQDTAQPSPDRIIAIPMSDGVVIRRRCISAGRKPQNARVLAASPYRFDNDAIPPSAIFPFSELGPIRFYNDHGYAYVHMDTRGTGRSGGTYTYQSKREQRDLYEAIEWLAKQPWSNGKIGGVGQSYYARSQWFMATQHPPHLACIAPYDGNIDTYHASAYTGGIRRLSRRLVESGSLFEPVSKNRRAA